MVVLQLHSVQLEGIVLIRLLLDYVLMHAAKILQTVYVEVKEFTAKMELNAIILMPVVHVTNQKLLIITRTIMKALLVVNKLLVSSFYCN